MKPVLVIGAGITGLAAAFRLKEAGVLVRVWEASPRVGGVVQSFRRGGHLIEAGPNSILETSPVITQLVESLGLAGRRMYSDPGAEKRFIVRGNKPVEMPASPAGFFGCGLFSAGAKLRLLREPFIAAAPPDIEESIEQFVLRRLGREFLDYAIDPMVAGIYAGEPARLSVLHAFPKLHALEQRYRSLILGQILGARARRRSGEVSKQSAKKFSFDEGLQVLIDTLAERLGGGLETGHPAGTLESRHGQWLAGGDEYAAVLLALPAHKLAALEIHAPGAPSLAPLAEVIYPPVASVVIGYQRADVAHPLDGFGALVPRKEGMNILGALFSSSLFPNRAPRGEVTLTAYVGGSRQPDLPLRPEAEIFSLVERDLARLFGITGAPTMRNLTVFPRAIPQYNVGYGKYRDLMSAFERTAPGLFIAGHARDGISIGDSIVSGCKAAATISKFLSAPDAEARRPLSAPCP